MRDKARIPVIVAGVRTPIGCFLGGLGPLSAPELGAVAIGAAVKRSGIDVTAVDEVINALAHHQASRGATTLEAFLDEVTLGQRKEETDKDAKLRRNAIAMMTLHSAKGLEFPQVYLVGMEEGILPHRRSIAENEAAIDEERRLCYVGVTRAQDRLTISFPLTRRKWGKRLETNPSRFLFELTGQAENLNLKSKTRNPKLKTRSR